jgi:hypothetical protein
MRDDEFAIIAREVWLYPSGVRLSPESALALLGEAMRARDNEQQLIARVRALTLPPAENDVKRLGRRRS